MRIKQTMFDWRVAFVAALLLVGFAAGFPIGQRIGFASGSEWSLIQAEILAREAGVFMPVNYKDGTFRVVVKQPRHLYRKAQGLADRYEREMTRVKKENTILLAERVQLRKGISLMQ